jgi:hypothetical protein
MLCFHKCSSRAILIKKEFELLTLLKISEKAGVTGRQSTLCSEKRLFSGAAMIKFFSPADQNLTSALMCYS